MGYVRRVYRVPAKRGGRVSLNGRQGSITSATHYIFVRFGDGPRWPVPLHPKEDGLRYLPDTPDGRTGRTGRGEVTP